MQTTMKYLLPAIVCTITVNSAAGFTTQNTLSKNTCNSNGSYKYLYTSSSSSLKATSKNGNLTPLPQGISPFEKSLSKSLDIQQEFRNLSKNAIQAAIQDSATGSLLEIEFPPLIGGDKSKSQFDDFDNVQELDANKDWTMQLAPMFVDKKEYADGKSWLM